MTYIDYIPDAIQMVSAWELPDDELIKRIHEQIQLMVSIENLPTDPSSNLPMQLPLDLN